MEKIGFISDDEEEDDWQDTKLDSVLPTLTLVTIPTHVLYVTPTRDAPPLQ